MTETDEEEDRAKLLQTLNTTTVPARLGIRA